MNEREEGREEGRKEGKVGRKGEREEGRETHFIHFLSFPFFLLPFTSSTFKNHSHTHTHTHTLR